MWRWTTCNSIKSQVNGFTTLDGFHQIGTWVVVHCISTKFVVEWSGGNGRKAEPAVQVAASYLDQTEGYWAMFAGCSIFVQGRFDILSQSGSFILSEMVGQKSRTGGLSIALAGPGGRVLGGTYAGLLVAASPVIVGSFLPEGGKANYMEPSSAPQKMSLGGGAVGTSSLPSRWTPSVSSDRLHSN
ncbi:hypothetical protein BUALT_Bualt08G0004900 [Buddleja alternifolia]|uniref:AT-hook motif nuclear-localized protein n=1 Tax=Buddleja alternifolia TaxID=168488 RepID=A0AAV6X4A0_9LAMI|nr:hypothetical protein BUALT_Bualt08G0004900 [Buddleja alternifolia]